MRPKSHTYKTRRGTNRHEKNASMCNHGHNTRQSPSSPHTMHKQDNPPIKTTQGNIILSVGYKGSIGRQTETILQNYTQHVAADTSIITTTCLLCSICLFVHNNNKCLLLSVCLSVHYKISVFIVFYLSFCPL